MIRNFAFIALLPLFFALTVSCAKDTDNAVPPAADNGSQQINEDELVKGVLRIKLSPELEARVAESGLKSGLKNITRFGVESLDEVAAGLGATRIERSFQIGGKYEPRQRKAGLHLWYTVFFDEDRPVTRAASSLGEVAGIEIAEPVYVIYTPDAAVVPAPAGQDGQAKSAATRADAAPFNDPLVGNQWHYRNYGTLNSAFKAGADVNLFKAWEITTGTSDVIVAVIDSGIDYNHIDLAANLWVNSYESAGSAGTDDDGNNYTDDIHGWNFHDGTPQSAIIMDGFGAPYAHGTHVAGTVAAVNNNGKGVGGVAGGDGTEGSGARIMACQINNGNSSNPDPNRILKAFQYGADNGAVIAQCSWGYGRTTTSLPEADKTAIDYFIGYAGTDAAGEFQTGPVKGGLVVFATGNWGNIEMEVYPARYSEVLSVTSMGADFEKVSDAVYGRWVSVIAPGGSDISGAGMTSQVYSTIPADSYGYMRGTSMACPHVSGIAALLASKYGKEHPGLTGKDIKRMIMNSTDDIYAYNPGYAGKLGTGYVDAYRALTMADDSEVTPAAPELGFTVYNRRIDMELTAKGDAGGIYPNRYTVLMSEREITNGDFDTAAADVIRSELTIDEVGAGGKYVISYPDLKSGTEYYFAVKAHTLFGSNTSILWREARTQNYNPPAAVGDLTIDLSGSSALAKWSVTADPDDTRALYYNLSWSKKNLAAENWNSIAADITTTRIDVGSKLSGQGLSYMITGLTANTVYYVSIQGVDAKTNESEKTFATFYTGSNERPRIEKELPALTFTGAGAVQQIDLSEYFSNDDPLGLIYTVTVSPENSLNSAVEGDILSVALAEGYSGSGTFTVTATDFAGLSVSSTASFSANSSASSTVSQLVRDAMTVTFPGGTSGTASVRVYNAAGNVVKNVTAQIPAGLQLAVDMGSVSGGVYTVVLKYGSREDKHTIVKL